MKPPNLIEMFNQQDRGNNTDTITPQTDTLLTDVLALVERAREIHNSESSPNRYTRAQISIICLAINQLGNDAFNLLRSTKVEEIEL